MMLSGSSHATDVTNMGQINLYFFYSELIYVLPMHSHVQNFYLGLKFYNQEEAKQFKTAVEGAIALCLPINVICYAVHNSHTKFMLHACSTVLRRVGSNIMQ